MVQQLINSGRLLKYIPRFLADTETLKLDFFAGKRVAVVGPASSAYEKEMADYIDGFDVVVRVNRAVEQFEKKPERNKYVGTKTTLLFHQLMRHSLNTGEIDGNLLRRYGVEHLVFNRSTTRSGIRKVLEYYEQNPNGYPITLLDRDLYRTICRPFEEPQRLRPTNGYIALAAVLMADFEEVYITGLTFYRTPYAPGYRDNAASYDQMLVEGWHNPDVEFEEFKKLVKSQPEKRILLDDGLKSLI
jgi:hypothetical protein